MLRNLLMMVIAGSLIGCGDSEVGDVSLGLFTTKDIKIDS